MSSATSVSDIKPQYLSGLAILFWGYQVEELWFALPMAIILEARYFLNRRWALTQQDFYRVADLTSLGLILMIVFLFMNRREYHFITTLIMWMPLLVYPLTIVLAYSTTKRMTLDVMFYSLRRQREPVTQSWDMDYILLGTCLLSAGIRNEGTYYFPVVAAVILAALYQLRSDRFPKSVFILSMSAVFISAMALHMGIREAHLEVKHRTEQWIYNWISQRTDPLRTRTALGQLGRLKLSDSIKFRIEPESGQPDFPPLLREATYNSPGLTDWEVFDPGFDQVEQADDFLWHFRDPPLAFAPQAKIYLEFDRKTALIPVPGELTEIYELPAQVLKSSIYGTVKGEELIPAPYYRLRYDTTGSLGKKPSRVDLEVPRDYQKILDELTPADVKPAEALAFTREFFQGFRYTLYQRNAAVRQDPLRHFLTRSKAGHCEYFAGATAMLLRQMGVPARYVVGFSVQEWNNDLQMYVIRERHAHAWAEAYIDGRWITVDTTPSEWLAMEENQSGLLQPLWDLIGNKQFQLGIWWNDQKLEDYERELYVIGGILVLILIWRISTSEQVIIDEDEKDESIRYQLLGKDSPFFKIEEMLAGQGFRRGQGELMTDWLLRIGRPELLPLLNRHNQWRFDPQGISIEDRQQLTTQVAEWLSENTDPETGASPA